MMAEGSSGQVERIVCLANSRKVLGRCIAGKRTSDSTWCRPISDRQGHELSEFDRRYEDGRTAGVLDIIEIPCLEPRPHDHQSENVLIDDRYYWTWHGCAAWDEVCALVDHDTDLWANGFSTVYNRNDRVPAALLPSFSGSLRLIELDEVILHTGPKAAEYGNMKRVVRVHFEYRGDEYRMNLSDPLAERHFLARGDGDYSLKSVVACISLAEVHTDGYAYKVMASIIRPERSYS